MTVSLLVSTYNWPRALYLCLDSVMQQTILPDEILIADDGSGMATRDVVKHFERISPVPVRHIWHEDRGFRVATIRNKAIAASTCDYIIQIDGDLILERHFVQDHILFAKPGCYVSGSRGIITEALTRQVLSGAITSLSALTKGVRCSNNVMRIPFMAIIYRMIAGSKSPRSCNMALWREDAIRVNGYDESFEGWGYEDTELGLRLDNSGVRQRIMKFRGSRSTSTTNNAPARTARQTSSAIWKVSASTARDAGSGLTATCPTPTPIRPSSCRQALRLRSGEHDKTSAATSKVAALVAISKKPFEKRPVMILAPHLPSPHQIERLALQTDMPALEEVIHGIEHPRRTTAVAMRLVKHRIIVNFAHQAVRTGQGPLNGRTHFLRFPDIEQIRTRMRIAECNNRLVEEHELDNDR